ncbi:uncharacterized protein LOC132722677 [Ruditapes philippinarum]|uniref:uncharacterized protein LOC132722677 n=1 Tax=Ruditapes philippinarum TaxID=129788 RepID=UPI00295A8072|nr:uncharacterized protein LOC132722677 [Ruditapes philippinarum]
MLYRRYAGTTLAFYIIYMFSRRITADVPSTDDIDPNIQYIQGMDTKNGKGLSDLRDTISSLDNYLANYQKRTCQFGLNSHHCKLSALDSILSASNWLNSGHSPGKRSQQITDPQLIDKYTKILDDVNRKRENLAVLNGILEDAEHQATFKRKRSCYLNLGGRCATELASAIADQYYYLNGPNSPGKRRKRSNLPLV